MKYLHSFEIDAHFLNFSILYKLNNGNKVVSGEYSGRGFGGQTPFFLRKNFQFG